MPPRIYTDKSLQPGETVALPKAQSTHLLKVLRLKVGAAVQLFNGDGYNYNAHLQGDNKRASLHIQARENSIPPSPLAITLVQGVSRGDRMDFSIQKAVELGVHCIQPVFSEKSKMRLDEERQQKKVQHWKSVAISACEQCGRSDIPEILPPQTLANYIANPLIGLGLVLAFGDHPNLATAAAQAQGKLSVLIGPESGISGKELAQSLAAGWQPSSLGPRILRTETATATALAVLQHAAGDLQRPPLF